ncbi:MAG: acyl-CoA carboxylase subunit beta [Acidimicrobiales bacterium]
MARATLEEIDGRQVATFRIEGGPHRGAIGPVEGETVERLIHQAGRLGVPVVGWLATSGAEVGAGIASLWAWGRLARALSAVSGVVPVIMVAHGPCLAGPSLLLGLADHVVMTRTATAFVSGPSAVADFTGVHTDPESLGGSQVHASVTGLASLVVDDEEEAAWAVADLLSYLPANYLCPAPRGSADDPTGRDCQSAADALPSRATASYDVRLVLGDVFDAESLFEVRDACAPNVVTAYARLGGVSVGVVANQPQFKAGTLDIEASRKAARFVQACDAFGLPIITFVDCPGYHPGRDLEWQGMIRHGAQLVHAYAAATVPRLCVVLRKAFGGAYIVMDSRGLGNDVCFAWPGAEIAVMGAAGAVAVLEGRRLAAISDGAERAARQAELELDYNARLCSPVAASRRGDVDEVIEPADTRRRLASALGALASKRFDPGPGASHTNTPL